MSCASEMCKDVKQEKEWAIQFAFCLSETQNASKTEPTFWEVFWGTNEHFAEVKRKFFQKSGKR